jgi:hypothetical protein
MDYDAKAGTSIYLHTKGFTFADVYRLAGIINFVFGLFVISFLPSGRKKNCKPKKKRQKNSQEKLF